MSEGTARDAPGTCGRSWLVASVLVFCVALVGFWEFMSNRSRRGWDAFDLSERHFTEFNPVSPKWTVRRQPVAYSPIEPNILSYELRRSTVGIRRSAHDAAGTATSNGEHAGQGVELNVNSLPVLVRLVHGYNMPDCMKLKHYRVELIGDYRADDKGQAEGRGVDRPDHSRPSVQIWRLTSSGGDVSIWVTGMLRAYDFGQTDVDVRSMAFPRADFDIGQDFSLRGVTWESLRSPWSNFKIFLKARWNSSRSDLMTFLGLRQPAWASREMLTLVAISVRPHSMAEAGESDIAGNVLNAYLFMLSELAEWRAVTAGKIN